MPQQSGTQTVHGQPSAGEKLAAKGQFIFTSLGRFYLPSGQSQPIALESRRFAALVGKLAGVSRRSGKFGSVLNEVKDYAELHHTRARAETCAAIVPQRDKLMVNLGDGLVAHIPAGQLVQPSENNRHGALFVDEPVFQGLRWQDLKRDIPEGWHQLPALHSAILDHLPPSREDGLTAAEQRALVAAAWIGVFLRDLAPERPILALVGPPESAKTATARLLGTAFYGAGYDVSGGAATNRMVKDVAAAVSSRSMVVRDDINAAPDGLMDLLCRCATGATFELSAFYETLDLVTYESRAALVLTAHQPRWATRADVLSRLLVIRLTKPPEDMIGTAARIQRVLAARPAIWAETLCALQAALQDRPRQQPVTRFADWEHFVRAVLEQAGMGEAFESALRKQASERTALIVEADPFLALLYAFALAADNRDKWFTAADLVDALAEFAGVGRHHHDRHRAVYTTRSPHALSRTLAHIERVGSTVVAVTRGVQKAHGNVLRWNIRPVAS